AVVAHSTPNRLWIPGHSTRFSPNCHICRRDSVFTAARLEHDLRVGIGKSIFLEHGPVVWTNEIKALNSEPSCLAAHFLKIHSTRRGASAALAWHGRAENAASDGLLDPPLPRCRFYVITLFRKWRTIESGLLRRRYVVRKRRSCK